MLKFGSVALRNKIDVTRLNGITQVSLVKSVNDKQEVCESGNVFLYALNGNVLVGSSDFAYLLKKGEMVCFRPFESHNILVEEESAEIVIVSFDAVGIDEELYENIITLSTKNRQFLFDLKTEYDAMIADSPEETYLYEQILKNTLELLVASLIKAKAITMQTRIDLCEKNSQRQTLTKNIIEYLYSNIGECVNLNEIANRFSYSLSSIKRIFKEETGYSIIAYLNDLRMQRAKDLLKSDNYSIEEIATATGFANVYYFSNAFKKKWEISPSHYRIKNKKRLSNSLLNLERENNMPRFKMVIADDERIISNSLKEMILQETNDIDIVEVFNNGEDVLEYLKHNHIDILISDIRMPIVDGLEVARYIHEQNLNTKVIIITGYREFEYAQKALEYHVNCLVTKPININELIQTINEIKTLISSELSDIYKDNEKNQSIRQIYRQAFFMLVNSNSGFEKVLNINNLDGVSIKDEECVVVDFYVNQYKSLDSSSFYDTMWRDMCEIKNSSIDAYCILEYNDYARFFVITNEKDFEASKNRAAIFAEETASLMKSAYGFNVSYNLSPIGEVRPVEHHNFSEIVNAYINYLLLGHKSKKEELLWIIKSYSDIEILKNFVSEIIDHLKLSFLPNAEEFSARLGFVTTEEEILDVLGMVENAVLDCPDSSGTIVSVVKNYISHYEGSDYSLASISTAIAYTPYYLSRIFKSETGENLSDYILDARINRAKKLLTNKEYNIAEIAKMVGFENASYFSRIFKKKTGKTPKQFSVIGE